ncbi:hypothetical protein C5S39_06275 [Candidatus Methanophagaceae archaeon]|nr:hypothetical protein C5S39_06275 [Methanophagales archaeon]
MNSIYITHTPYHILVSCGLASVYDDSDEKYLIIVSDFKDAEIICKTITNWENNPFTESKLLGGRFYVKKNDVIGGIRSARSNLKTLKRVLTERLNKASNTFIYHDGAPEGQILAYLNSKNGGTNIYVEDGFVIYDNFIAPDLAFYKKIVMKMLWGRFHEHVRVHGTYKHVDKIMVFRPELIRHELVNKELIKIPREVLTCLKDRGLISALLKSYNIDQKSLDVNYIFIIPHSDFLIENKLLKRYSNILNGLIPNLTQVYVKYHPREVMGDFLKIQKFSNVTVLPQSLPIEVVFLALHDKEPRIVISDAFTTLLTAKYLLERTEVISLIGLIGLKNSYLETVFEKIGILVPESIDDLKDLIDEGYKEV